MHSAQVFPQLAYRYRVKQDKRPKKKKKSERKAKDGIKEE